MKSALWYHHRTIIVTKFLLRLISNTLFMLRTVDSLQDTSHSQQGDWLHSPQPSLRWLSFFPLELIQKYFLSLLCSDMLTYHKNIVTWTGGSPIFQKSIISFWQVKLLLFRKHPHSSAEIKYWNLYSTIADLWERTQKTILSFDQKIYINTHFKLYSWF